MVSTAYTSVSPASSFWAKISFLVRSNAQAVIATSAFLGFVLILSSDRTHPKPSNDRGFFMKHNLRTAVIRKPFANFGGAYNAGYFKVANSEIDPNSYHFAAVSDLDQLSHIVEERKPTFRSLLLPGVLTRNKADESYSVAFEPNRELISQHNEAGRGMELSELTIFKDRLLTFDDRTGIVYELLNRNGGQETFPVPRLIITEGMGDTDKGMKWEWAAVKGSYLYIGSMGKEYTNPDGSVANSNNLWVMIVNQLGEVRREDWTEKFNFVRSNLGASRPGYIINEAVLWSDYLKRWIFIPRRVSNEMYDENEDERKGSNKIAIVDEDFTHVTIVEINFKDNDPLHGCSSFAFVPNTKDAHVLSIRSVEENCVGGDESLCKQRSYFAVFDVMTGNVLMDEVEAPLPVKFEGVEFVNIYAEDLGVTED